MGLLVVLRNYGNAKTEMIKKGQSPLETIFQAIVVILVLAIFIGIVGPMLYEISPTSGVIFIICCVSIMVVVLFAILRAVSE